MNGHANGYTNGYANGHANGHAYPADNPDPSFRLGGFSLDENRPIKVC